MTGAKRIGIIGAGISGLSCATALADSGFEPTVFDKGRAPGGRMSTRRVDIEGTKVGFDHGAQYFTVRHPELAQRVSRWESLGVARRWEGRIAVLAPGGVVESYNDMNRFVGTPSMSAICEHLAVSVDVRCKVAVGRLQRGDSGVELFDDGGCSLGAFDFAVVTAPPIQTAALLKTCAPDLAARARSVVMNPCWAVMAAFDSPLDVPFDGAFVNEGPLRWIARASSKPGRMSKPERWVLHASATWSADHIDDSSDKVARSLLHACFRALGRPPRAAIWANAHRWRHALAADPLEKQVLVDAETQILACGDWANGNRVEGAFLSGLAAAKAVVEKRGPGKP